MGGNGTQSVRRRVPETGDARVAGAAMIGAMRMRGMLLGVCACVVATALAPSARAGAVPPRPPDVDDPFRRAAETLERLRRERRK